MSKGLQKMYKLINLLTRCDVKSAIQRFLIDLLNIFLAKEFLNINLYNQIVFFWCYISHSKVHICPKEHVLHTQKRLFSGGTYSFIAVTHRFCKFNKDNSNISFSITVLNTLAVWLLHVNKWNNPAAPHCPLVSPASIYKFKWW